MTLEDRLDLRHKIFKGWEGVYYVALWKDKVIGFCDSGMLRFHENQLLSEEQRQTRTEMGEIYALYILEEHQGKGVGRALFQEIRLRIQEKGLSPFLA